MTLKIQEAARGPRIKSGVERFSADIWETMSSFIKSRIWYFDNPPLASDKQDSLLANKLPFGAFMLGFDFHLTPEGPRLIEINTNAGGLATALSLNQCLENPQELSDHFVKALQTEFELARPAFPLRQVAIVDDDVQNQPLYPEMKTFARMLEEHGISTCVISPEQIISKPDGLYFQSQRLDLIYNRLVDFRLLDPAHAVLRQAALKGDVILTPHPAAYVRIADKRNLIRLKHPLVPQAHLLSERALEDWMHTRKKWVFKPFTGAGSKGVYRGDKISLQKLRSLPAETIVQEYVSPPVSMDGTKYDLRIYTRDTDILALAARHFSGQVMEMSSQLSGFKAILPHDVCCLEMLKQKIS